MLFSSPWFLFAFLPAALLAYHAALAVRGGRAALGTLVLASFVFYGLWEPFFLLLLGGSLAVNYAFARALCWKPSGALLALGVGVNLAVLGYFKYRLFVAGLLGAAPDGAGALVIPLAISFFTFEQIALLVDIRDGTSRCPPPMEFAAYVTMYPHLIAGPIVLYRELDVQFRDLRDGKGAGLAHFGPGVVVFLGGLFKKVVIADNVAPYADMAFALGGAISTVEAWAGALAFALQLYFDFCGYSEMAVGLGLMLGIVLPLNFDRPYRATSMVDFWKRWHMTMTRFFMMYVYAPLAVSLGRASHGGGRPGLASFALAVAAPTMAAFLLSGLWHGAGWTFVAFGAVNGLGLVVNHAWRLARPFPVPAPLGRFLTALTVLVSFVYFRATDLGHAHAFLRAMFDPGRFLMPNWLSGLAERTGMAWTTLAMFSSGAFAVRVAVWLALAAALSVVLPNWAKAWREIRPRWRLAWGMALAVCLIGTWLGQPRTFIYFQF